MSSLKLERITVKQMPQNPYWDLFFGTENKSKKYFVLRDGNHLVMSDAPLEIAIAKKMAKQLKGHVLILGAGIGLLNSFIEPGQCESVTVVDHDEVAFDYAKRYLRGKKYQAYKEVVADANDHKQMTMLDGHPFDVIVSDLYSDRVEARHSYQDLLAKDGLFLRWSFDY